MGPRRTASVVRSSRLLSFYFLLAFFPLLIVFSTLIGFVLSSQVGTYIGLLNYLDRIMPRSAFTLFSGLLGQITAGASGGKLSLGVLVSLWTASSGVAALIEALNIAFEVSVSRSWLRRRAMAMALTLGIVLVLAACLAFLFATSTAGALITARVPLLGALAGISNVVRWLVGILLLLLSLTLIYGFGPNLNRKRWEGILPGSCFALLCWLIASLCLRLYLSNFPLSHSYGSLAGVIALLFWLYLSAAAILLGRRAQRAHMARCGQTIVMPFQCGFFRSSF